MAPQKPMTICYIYYIYYTYYTYIQIIIEKEYGRERDNIGIVCASRGHPPLRGQSVRNYAGGVGGVAV